ncbi:alpha/beta fold hydrolase [Microcella flavibacter]|uniref:alpha/beta fold hydrolase n=1 Tax=Microcella flavibacter TaxID=1804990 RepID=UPI00145723ED|nr:alpha/beta hydrolase [Microcella flavibacter]
MRASRFALAAAAFTPALAWAGVHAGSPEARRWRPGAGERMQAGELGVRIHGTGDAVVVLLSGLASSERMWGEAYDVLGRRACVIAIDPMGFGASMTSPALDHPVDADAHVDAVLGVLHELGLHEQPAIIVGHSMGASLALRVAARHPAARAVVAFDAPLYATVEEADERVRHMGSFEALLAQGPLAMRVCQWMCDNRAAAQAVAVAISPRLPITVARDAVQHTWHGYTSGFDSLIRDTGWQTALHTLASRGVPVWLIDGETDPVPVPGRADALAREHEKLTAIQFPGGHRLPLSDPAGCASMINHVLSVYPGRSPRTV